MGKFNKKNKSFVAIDIGEESIRLLQYNIKNNEIDLLGLYPLVPADKKDKSSLGKKITDLIKSSEVVGTDIVASVSVQNVLCKRLSMGTGRKGFREQLVWEVEQQLLDSTENYKIDFQEIDDGLSQKDNSDFLVVACRKDYIEELTKLVKTNGLVPSVIDVDIFALQNCFEFNYPQESKKSNLIVYADGKKVLLVLCFKGMVFDYEVFYGSDDENEKAKVIKDKIDVFLSFPKNERLIPLSGMWLSGSIVTSKEMLSALREKFNEVSVQTLEPFKTLNVKKELTVSMKKYLPFFSVASGMIVRKING